MGETETEAETTAVPEPATDPATAPLDADDEPAPRVRRYRCAKCYALHAAERLRCGSCNALCSILPVDLGRQEATIHETLPYRDKLGNRRRAPDDDRHGPGGPDDPYGNPGEGGDGGTLDRHEDDDDDDVDENEQDNDEPEDIENVRAEDIPRHPTGLHQFDALFGGGIPLPGVIMFGATPGVGKSRLTLEIGARRAHTGHRTLVVLVEESKPQVAARAKDMKLAERFPRAFGKDRLHLYKTQSLERLLNRLDEVRYKLVFVDSVFMMESSEVDGAAGKPSQLAHVVKTLYSRAHATDEFVGCKPFSLLLIAHGTKENVEAGTNTAKHWVDSVVFGERTHPDGTTRQDQRRPTEGEKQFFRVFSTGKNRFGASDRVAHFEMTHPNGVPMERVVSAAE